MHRSRYQEITAQGSPREHGRAIGHQSTEAIVALHKDDFFSCYDRRGIGRGLRPIGELHQDCQRSRQSIIDVACASGTTPATVPEQPAGT